VAGSVVVVEAGVSVLVVAEDLDDSNPVAMELEVGHSGSGAGKTQNLQTHWYQAHLTAGRVVRGPEHRREEPWEEWSLELQM
jgi:hypothetical protein